MFSKNGKISEFQFFCLLVADILGAGCFLLPKSAAEKSGGAAWLGVAAAGAASALVVYLALKISGGFFWGKLPKAARILAVAAFGAKVLFAAAFNAYIFANWLKSALLPSINAKFAAGLILALAAYAAAGGIEGRARLAQILLPAAFLPFIASVLSLGSDVDFSALTLPNSAENFTAGAVSALPYFGGAELAFIMSGKVRKRAPQAAFWAIAFCGAAFTVLCCATLSGFGVKGAVSADYPALSVMGGGGALGASFAIIAVFMAVNACIFAASDSFADVFLRRGDGAPILAVAALAFALVFFPKNTAEAAELRDFVNLAGLAAFLVGLPLVVGLCGLLEKIGGYGREKTV